MEIEDIDKQSQNQPLMINEIDENFQISQDQVEEGVVQIPCVGVDFSECDKVCDHAEKGEVDIPYVGVEFSSVEEAYNFYNMYAKGKGFSVRKSDVTKLKSGEVSSRLYVCNKEPIHDPERAKTKGRPRAPSRIQSGKEICQTQAQIRTRTCSICKGKGHDMRTCSLSKEH